MVNKSQVEAPVPTSTCSVPCQSSCSSVSLGAQMIHCLFSSCDCQVVTTPYLMYHLDNSHHVQIVDGLHAVIETTWNNIGRRVPVILRSNGVYFAVMIEESENDVFIWVTQIEEQEQDQTSPSNVDFRIQIRLDSPFIQRKTRTFSQIWEGRSLPFTTLLGSVDHDHASDDAFSIKKSCVLKNFCFPEKQGNGIVDERASSLTAFKTTFVVSIAVVEFQLCNHIVHQNNVKVKEELAIEVLPPRETYSSNSSITSNIGSSEYDDLGCLDSKVLASTTVLPDAETVISNDSILIVNNRLENSFSEEIDNQYTSNEKVVTKVKNSEDMSVKPHQITVYALNEGTDEKVSNVNENNKTDIQPNETNLDDDVQERLKLLQDIRSIRLPTKLPEEVQGFFKPELFTNPNPELEDDQFLPIFTPPSKQQEQGKSIEMSLIKPVAVKGVPIRSEKTKVSVNRNQSHKTKANKEYIDYPGGNYYITGYPAVARHKATILDLENGWEDALVAELAFFNPDIPLSELADDIAMANSQDLLGCTGSYRQNWQLEPDVNLMEAPSGSTNKNTVF